MVACTRIPSKKLSIHRPLDPRTVITKLQHSNGSHPLLTFPQQIDPSHDRTPKAQLEAVSL